MQKKIRQLAAESRDSLYMQDYSYFRQAAGVSLDAEISSPYSRTIQETETTDSTRRWGVASVCLFHLNDDGKLEPLAIVCDWRGDADKSVTIYNKQLGTSDQKEDWPWRYGELCLRHSPYCAYAPQPRRVSRQAIGSGTN